MKMDKTTIKNFCDNNLVFASGMKYAEENRVENLVLAAEKNIIT